MKRRIIAAMPIIALAGMIFTGCGKSEPEDGSSDGGGSAEKTEKNRDAQETEIQVFIAASLNTVMTELAEKYNEEHHITPKTIRKAVRDLISISRVIAKEELRFEKDPESMSRKELEKLVADIEKQMKKAAADLNFEAAAELRDKMVELKKKLKALEDDERKR